MMQLARGGLRQLFHAQREALGEKWPLDTLAAF
jgi:hypothetical protein